LIKENIEIKENIVGVLGGLMIQERRRYLEVLRNCM
jgi:hypothetical protein